MLTPQTISIMIIGLDCDPETDGRRDPQMAEGMQQWQRQPFSDGGRLQLDRKRAVDWDNLYYELGVLARIDSLAFGLRGIFQTGAIDALPIARNSWDRATDHRPSVTAWCDTVGLGDIVNVPSSGEFKFDFANQEHIELGWTHYLKPFFDSFGSAKLTRSPRGNIIIPWWGIAPNTGHGIQNQVRKRPLDEYYSKEAPEWLKRKGDREAINDPIQGGAADIFKIGMVKLGKLIRANKWQEDLKQTLWIHDEFVLRVRRSMLAQIVPEAVKCLEFEVKGWPIKLKVDVEVGWNWGEMIPWEAYQVLGKPGLSLTPWKNYEEPYKQMGAAILSTPVSEEDAEDEEEPSMDRSSYGY